MFCVNLPAASLAGAVMARFASYSATEYVREINKIRNDVKRSLIRQSRKGFYNRMRIVWHVPWHDRCMYNQFLDNN